MRTALAATALIATTLVAQAPTAQAAVINRPFDMETIAGPVPPDGSARIKGSLAWHDQTKVVATGWIDDRCPADGYGAYLYAQVRYMNGDANNRGTVAKDTRTCNATAHLPLVFLPVVFDSTRWIKHIRLCVAEYDMYFARHGDRMCESFHNPHT
ncbi:hypothetical protein [Kribbella sp. CA-294648]|uniref:hypothetical protein n=1 Tax=Kribbella sp. CA-294648 TaxID=3239948 RepID=UPI003D89C20D